MQHSNEEKYVYYDSSNVKHEIEIVDGDFNLASVDKKIHDVKFKTKPTTFWKDAFKRFCKNKSSVVGAVIVGVLVLLAIFVPVIDQYDVDSNHPQERLLEPKLFNAGTGFWDGTRKMEDIVCDQSTAFTGSDGNTYYYPFEDSYTSSAITNLSLPVENNEINTASSGVTGGWVRITNSNQLQVWDEENAEENAITYSSYAYAFDIDQKYSLDIIFGDDEIEDMLQGDFRIYLSYSYEGGLSTAGEFDEFEYDESAEDEVDPDDEDAYVYPFAGTWEGELDDGNSYTLVLSQDNTGTLNGTDIEFSVEREYHTYNEENEDESTYYYTITGESSDNVYSFEFVYDDENPNVLTVNELNTTEVNEYNLTGTELNPYIQVTDLEQNDDGEYHYSTDDLLEGIQSVTQTNNGSNTLESLSICIDLLPGEQVNTYLLIRSIDVGCTSDTSEDRTISDMGFDDANASLLISSTSDIGYWRCNGTKTLYHGTAYTCSFTYNTYEATYGNMSEVVPLTTIKQYAENGWLSSEILDDDYDWSQWVTNDTTKLAELYASISTDLTEDYCPIYAVTRVTSSSASGIRYYTITCLVSKYKLLGYTSMPRFLLGTDGYGRDMLKVTFVGLRNSLLIALGIAAVCFVFGLVWGAISGYYGGNVDIIMERIIDFLTGIPWIVIVTLCVLNLGNTFGVFLLAMCLTGWTGTASTTRTQFYRFRDREYTLASRTLGASNIRLIFKHILPNAMGTIITSSVLMIPSVIFSEATVSYLGLGFTDIISLGVTLSDNQQYLSTYPYLIIFPSVIMALIMISFNLLGNGLRDAFNPSLKGSE